MPPARAGVTSGAIVGETSSGLPLVSVRTEDRSIREARLPSAELANGDDVRSQGGLGDRQEVLVVSEEENLGGAGQLAQDVQVSAFPERYDQRRAQALSLISTYCSK